MLPPPVAYKHDGARFDSGEDITVKLLEHGRYSMTLVCSPPSTIESADIQVGMLKAGRPARAMHACLLNSFLSRPPPHPAHTQNTSKITAEPMPLELTSDVQEGMNLSTHTAPWICDSRANKKSQRSHYSITVKIRDFGTLVIPLQVKVRASALPHGCRALVTCL